MYYYSCYISKDQYKATEYINNDPNYYSYYISKGPYHCSKLFLMIHTTALTIFLKIWTSASTTFLQIYTNVPRVLLKTYNTASPSPKDPIILSYFIPKDLYYSFH